MVGFRWPMLCLIAFVAGGAFAAIEPGSAVPVRIEPSSADREPRSLAPPPTNVPAAPEVVDEVVGGVDRDIIGARFASGVTISGAMPHRMLLLTFDDGPSRRFTMPLLDTLDKARVRALFFVTTQSFGRGNPWEREHAEIVREIARRGHLIGNHTETHRQLPLLSNAQIGEELGLSEAKIAHAIGRRPRLIRPPGGALSPRVERLLAERGYTTVLWKLYGGDLEVETHEQVVRTFFRVLERRERETGDKGGIVLLHDTKRHTLEAVPQLLASIRERNCELLKTDEQLYDVVDDLSYFMPEGHPRPRSVEARQRELRERLSRDCRALAQR